MRHAASLITAMEGMSRPAFRIAHELSQNSRAGLTVRFLAKKLELPEEEIEYLVDVNDRLFFIDLTKVKLVAEGPAAVKRIADGLENHGDIPSLFRRVKALGPHDFRRLEEQIGIERVSGKKAVAEELIGRYYHHPEAVVEYVASNWFSPMAREVFDVLWQSPDGVMPVSMIRVSQAESEYEIEQALWELFQGFALFEMFRFDSEVRLVRVAGLLSEIRQWREADTHATAKKTRLRGIRGKPARIDGRGLGFSDKVCRLVAAVAARAARLRGDGDLFREDRRRLSEVCPEYEEPSLSTCLWVAQGVGWLARVDNELRVGDLEDLIKLERLARHKILFDWLKDRGSDADSRRVLGALLDEMKPGAWYSTVGFVRHAMRIGAQNGHPVLKSAGGHWHYVNPAASANAERTLARSLEEAFHWLGVVDRAEIGEESVFQVTDLGRYLLTGVSVADLGTVYPERDAEIIVQPNFDIVVPVQEVDPLLTVPLDQFAARLSTDQVTLYHLSKESFTRAVQEGHDGDAFVEYLLAHNRGGGLPSNVMTTLDDWRGGMKHVRLRTLHVLEADDPLVMADLLHRRRFKKHLTPLDTSRVVSYSRIAKADLAKELEKEGFVVE